MYKAYDSYASFRLRSAAWDNTHFWRYGFLELMAAHLDPGVYAKPQTWIALGAGIGSCVLTMLASPDPWQNAVWNTGEWFVGESLADPAAIILARKAGWRQHRSSTFCRQCARS